MAAHIAELKPQFVFAPDTHIKQHPVRIESGDWTSVIGVMDEEYLFWDNASFMAQIGLAK